MSAIKLPVVAFPGELFWSVRDANGVEFVRQQPESVAREIVLALNMHDDLMRIKTLAVDYSHTHNHPDCEPWREIRMLAPLPLPRHDNEQRRT